MVLSKDDLLSTLKKESRILAHLAEKVEPSMVDYRPTPKQRSTIELLKYLSVMGPALATAAKKGFDPAAWTEADTTAQARNFEQTVAALAAHADTYASLLGDYTDADFRQEIEIFGRRTTRGSFLVNSVLSGCAAYRTQLFLYLKACGRDELNTMNLWAGVDAPMAAV